MIPATDVAAEVTSVARKRTGIFAAELSACHKLSNEYSKRWMEAEKEPESFKKFLDQYIYWTKDFNEYLDSCGGIHRINELRAQEHLIDVPNNRKE
jgi:glutaconate CoA-transferase subunit A